jgi:hypothetical protein
MKSLTLNCARALRDGGIDAVAALDAALLDALAEAPPNDHHEIRIVLGRAMVAVLDETVNPAVSAYPELDPDEKTWREVVRARAAARAAL